MPKTVHPRFLLDQLTSAVNPDGNNEELVSTLLTVFDDLYNSVMAESSELKRIHELEQELKKAVSGHQWQKYTVLDIQQSAYANQLYRTIFWSALTGRDDIMYPTAGHALGINYDIFKTQLTKKSQRVHFDDLQAAKKDEFEANSAAIIEKAKLTRDALQNMLRL